VQVTKLDWGLTQKAIVVTGGSSGIGAATVRALGSAGASVAVLGRDEARLRQVADEAESRGGHARIITVELEDAADAARAVEEAAEALGPLHGLVHCASLFDPRPLEETSIEGFEKQWRTNVAAPFAMTQAALPHLAPGGAIVLVASTVACVGFPGCAAYTATKGAVEAMGRALAVELAPRQIRVNVLAPGFVRTPMLQPHLDATPGYEDQLSEKTPVGRIGEPEELAASVLFLLSGLSTYIDGATLVADGGWIAQ
jgi:NAD(P)-dependent dehydrogenase (short-subunit alcohol dehydrogenase family)